MPLAVVVALIGALLGAGGLTALVQARSVNERTRAEADKAEAEAQVTLGGGWQVLWQAARNEVIAARAEVNELRERVAVVERAEEQCQRRLARLEARHLAPEKVEEHVAGLLDRKIAEHEEHP